MCYDHELTRVYHIMEHQDLHEYVLRLDAKKYKTKDSILIVIKTEVILPLYQILNKHYVIVFHYQQLVMLI